nr:hypothetical protein [Tanacetum cinerariifolium]
MTRRIGTAAHGEVRGSVLVLFRSCIGLGGCRFSCGSEANISLGNLVSKSSHLREYSGSGRAKALQVPEIYETNALASSWGCPKTKLQREDEKRDIPIVKRTGSLCVVPGFTAVTAVLKPEHLKVDKARDQCIFYQLSHSEIVDIEKVAVRSSLRSPNNKMTMEILLEPTSSKLLVGDVGDSILIEFVILDINLGPEVSYLRTSNLSMGVSSGRSLRFWLDHRTNT